MGIGRGKIGDTRSALEFISIVSKRNELGLYDMLTLHDFYVDLEFLRNQIVDKRLTKNDKE